ncbi:HAD-IC family P-type ATPase [Desulfotomaculum copahuensis]|uniref:Cation-transporting P-type ATPase N-terminal domain-containing protein n=1 Tax=Desulfotomaculum copahuensis TaxID=1838280 RepID=A0A1B7LER6_9FIRM|nr:HAD-IC family P-type ATPase [Desulfotomaculum copahuensis]OAT81774.1 hypothetical protein A6M21_10265 [Desulfotomaculum copahuensis]
MAKKNPSSWEIVHYLPGRVRIAVPGVKRNRQLLEQVAAGLSRLAEVREVRGNAASGRILVTFAFPDASDPYAGLKSLQNILTGLDTLVNFSETPAGGAIHVPAGGRAAGNMPARLTEPEDLPLRRQFFNVVLSGAVLAVIGVKHLFRGPSRLSRSPLLFHLTAVAALVSGYPVLKSGLHHLSVRRRMNFDFLLGAAGLGTMLLRESVPGLLVLWLVNLNALLQSLVLSHSLSLARRECLAPGLTEKQAQTLSGHLAGPGSASTDNGESAGGGQEVSGGMTRTFSAGGTPGGKESAAAAYGAGSRDVATRYGDRMLPVALGFSALAGLLGRDLNRSLAMLLAASPGPAGLAGRTARAAGLVTAGREGIRVIHPPALSLLPAVNVLILAESWVKLPLLVNHFYTLPGYERPAVQRAAADLLAAAGHPLSAAGGRGSSFMLDAPRMAVQVLEAGNDGLTGTVNGMTVSVGSAGYLRARGVDPAWGLLKARRFASLGATPFFIALNDRLAAVMGVTHRIGADTAGMLEGLRARGIERLILFAGEHEGVYRAAAAELGLECWSGLTVAEGVEKIISLKRQGLVVAVAAAGEGEETLLAAADLGLTGLQAPWPVREAAAVMLPPDALPRLFSLGRAIEQRERQNLHLVAGMNALGLVLGSTGRLLPVAATIFNNLISVAVTLNSYRLFFPGRARAPKPAGEPAGGGVRPALVPVAAGRADAAPVVIPAQGNTAIHNGNWSQLDVAAVLEHLQTDAGRGLTAAEAARRLAACGPNRLEAAPAPGLLARFIVQMKDFLVQALLGSSIVCLFAGEFFDALAIMVIILLNGMLGAVQEHKAEGAMEALKEMTIPVARVLRDGQWQQIASPDLVPGDVIMLEAGDGVPADARLLEINELQVMEAALTGESCPVPKDTCAPLDCVSLLDCQNMIFMGTVVTRGRCRAVIVTTGMLTELGQIADLLAHYEHERTPLQNNLADVGKIVLKSSLAVSALVIAAGIWRGGGMLQMFLTGISLAVAAIPEGLPAIVTVALASGVRRMARSHAVVRRLPAVENLGSATLICTDKTGTLTRNEQAVRLVYCADGGWWRASGPGYDPEGGGFEATDDGKRENLVFVLMAASLCSNARLIKTGASGREWQVDGDPTEGALLAAAGRAGIKRDELEKSFTRLREIPFDSERCRMTVVCRNPAGEKISFVKGAPDVILKLCRHYQGEQAPAAMDELARRRFLKANENLTAAALRVLAVAYRPMPVDDAPADEELIFLGLIGMQDPPRPEVRPAIAACHRAGIKVVMITGDHRNTALAIGRELGLIEDAGQVLTGAELEQMDDRQLQAALESVRVFARVLPRHKLRLVRLFKQRGELVAMIGDGVNDAPAVKEADIGVAMGISGTEVTKQASQLILTDDNFTTVVGAVEQGRGICANVRRSVRYLLATNVGEVLLMFFTVMAGLPLPLLPIQLLWLNLLGDGLPAVALSVDPPDPAVMEQPPRNFKAGLFDSRYVSRIISRGLAIGVTSLGAYWWGLRQGNLMRARTLALAAITTSQLVHALDCRRDGTENVKTANRFLDGAVGLSGALLLSAVYLPLGRRIFKTFPLSVTDWGTVFGSALCTNALDYLSRPVISGLLPPGPPISSNQEANTRQNNNGGE